jgi:hypothetical protein
MNLQAENLYTLLEGDATRPQFLQYVETVASIATRRNSTLTKPPDTTPQTQTTSQNTAQPTPNTRTPLQINPLTLGEPGNPGIRLRGVALFMDSNTERVGIAFCNARGRSTVYLSPGLGALLNGSTFKISMKRRVYDALQTVTFEKHTCRIVRKNNKTIALFSGGNEVTEFAEACKVLSQIGARGTGGNVQPVKISVDAMVVGYLKGETEDYLGALSASKHHEVIVYEDRGQNLNHLIPRTPEQDSTTPPTDCWNHPIVETDISGSERLQLRVLAEKTQAKRNAKNTGEKEDNNITKSSITSTLSKAFRAIPNKTTKKLAGLTRSVELETAVESFTEPIPPKRDKTPSEHRTKADMGLVTPPKLRSVDGPQDHMLNAFIEFVAVTKATRKTNEDTCKNIMQAYLRGNMGLLRARLSEAEAAVYDNDTSTVIHGKMSGSYMAAYSNTGGFVVLDDERMERDKPPVFITPPQDPIVVVAKCTKVMLDGRILDMANAISGDLSDGKKPAHWTKPTISWVNGVPGCGKTTWVMSQINIDRDIVVTTTTETAKDLREKLELRFGKRAKKRVRTMASILVNGMREGESCTHLMVDEALMNHFGSIVLAIQIAKAREVTLLGDANQLPYIDRCNLFAMKYVRPNLLTTTKLELLCNYRNPQDVAFALSEVYCGIYSSNIRAKSLTLKKFTGVEIAKSERTLYLVHTQAEKASLIGQGYGNDEGSRTLTIHEAQGQTFDHVVIVQTIPNKQSILLQSVPHAVVAVSRHKKTCVYHTDNPNDDATARLILRAESATEANIRDYNIRMAMRRGDEAVRDRLIVAKHRAMTPSEVCTSRHAACPGRQGE